MNSSTNAWRKLESVSSDQYPMSRALFCKRSFATTDRNWSSCSNLKEIQICLIALTRYHFLIIVFVNRFTHLHRIWITKWGTERGLWTFGIHSHWQVCILNLEPECELFIMLVSIYLFLATNPLLSFIKQMLSKMRHSPKIWFWWSI